MELSSLLARLVCLLCRNKLHLPWKPLTEEQLQPSWKNNMPFPEQDPEMFGEKGKESIAITSLRGQDKVWS